MKGKNMLNRYLLVPLIIILTFGIVYAAEISESNVFTDTTGLKVSQTTTSTMQPSAASDLVAMGLRGNAYHDSTNDLSVGVSEVGHYIGVFGGFEIKDQGTNTSGDVNFGIGTEGYFFNEEDNAIEIGSAYGLFSHLAGNKHGNITHAVGLGIGIHRNSGVITNAIGINFSMNGSEYGSGLNDTATCDPCRGDVDNVYGMFFDQLGEPVSNAEYKTVTGFYFANQTGLSGSPSLKAFHNADDEAQIYTEATTQSTSKDTGSIVTEGGIGAEKDIYSGGGIHAPAGLTYSLGANLTNHTTNPGAWANTIIMAKGKPAYYDSTDSRWEYISPDDTAVSW